MVSNGDEIDVHGFGICQINEDGNIVAYLVEEEDESINWYLNPERSDIVLATRKVNFIRES